MGMDLRGSIFFNCGSFAPNFREAIKMHFDVKNSNSTKIDLRGIYLPNINTNKIYLELLFTK